MAIVEVKVPDIGDFQDVPVIEVLVKPGDSVKPEDPLVTLESDKATMDVPSPAAGTVKAIATRVGDKVSEGSVLMTLDSGAAASPQAAAATEKAGAAPSATDKVAASATLTATGVPARVHKAASEWAFARAGRRID